MTTDSRPPRWQQRYSNFLRALQALHDGVQLASVRALTPLEQQGLIHTFEFTHELAWNVLKDYLDYQGVIGITGSRDASREAFKRGLVADGEVWMDMIRARNLSSHTYNQSTATALVDSIEHHYYPAFVQLQHRFATLSP